MNTHLLERLDARLKEFISTEELPWGGGLSGNMDKPNYPSLWLSRSADPGLMKLPGEGSAMVRYKVKRREIDESREDGQPLYGASIEIQSLEPVAEECCDDEEGETEDLEETLFLREFGSAGLGRLNRVSKSIYKKSEKGFLGHAAANKALRPVGVKEGVKIESMIQRGAKGGFQHTPDRVAGTPIRKKIMAADSVIAARKRAAMFEPKRALESTLFLRQFAATNDRRQFAEARDRDGEGRFAAGNVPGPQDYALAGMMARNKKKVAAAAGGVGVLAGGAALARTERGRQIFKKAGEAAMSATGRMIR